MARASLYARTASCTQRGWPHGQAMLARFTMQFEAIIFLDSGWNTHVAPNANHAAAGCVSFEIRAFSAAADCSFAVFRLSAVTWKLNNYLDMIPTKSNDCDSRGAETIETKTSALPVFGWCQAFKAFLHLPKFLQILYHSKMSNLHGHTEVPGGV